MGEGSNSVKPTTVGDEDQAETLKEPTQQQIKVAEAQAENDRGRAWLLMVLLG